MSRPTQTLEQQYVDACQRGDLGRRTRLETQLEQDGRTPAPHLEKPGALLNAALYYAHHGIAVFPCEPRGKRPITAQGFKNASTEPGVIRTWWLYTPDANIGTPTGHLFDVVDLDGPDAVAAVYSGDVKLPAEIGHSLTSRPAGHHVFIAPTGRGNGANILPGVDYRGAGGYVILPPSIGANGARYVWTRPLEVAA